MSDYNIWFEAGEKIAIEGGNLETAKALAEVAGGNVYALAAGWYEGMGFSLSGVGIDEDHSQILIDLTDSVKALIGLDEAIMDEIKF